MKAVVGGNISCLPGAGKKYMSCMRKSVPARGINSWYNSSHLLWSK